MNAWYLLSYQARIYKKVMSGLEGLNIECYSPKRTTLQKRADKKNSFRKREQPLFDGYMFVNFDPEDVHTTEITQRPGVNYFVRFGKEPKQVPDGIIDALKMEEFKHFSSPDNDNYIHKVPMDVQSLVSGIHLGEDSNIRVKELLEYLHVA